MTAAPSPSDRFRIPREQRWPGRKNDFVRGCFPAQPLWRFLPEERDWLSADAYERVQWLANRKTVDLYQDAKGWDHLRATGIMLDIWEKRAVRVCAILERLSPIDMAAAVAGWKRDLDENPRMFARYVLVDLYESVNENAELVYRQSMFWLGVVRQCQSDNGSHHFQHSRSVAGG
jgi:hypothetical protein